MAKVIVNEDNTWVQVFPGQEGYDTALEVGQITVVDSGTTNDPTNPARGGTVLRDDKGKITVDTTASSLFGATRATNIEGLQDVPDELTGFDVGTGFAERSEDVKAVQQMLVDAGYDLGKFGPEGDGVDGAWGDVSQKALEDYLADRGSIISANEALGLLTGPAAIVTDDDDDDSNEDTINAFKEWTLAQKQAAEAAAAASLQSAREILAGLVADFGLPSSLAEKLNAELIRGESPTALAMRIRTTDEYKARFPAMAQRRELGLPAISETEYLNIERQYRSIMQAAKLPATFHDAPEDFDQWIAGDVSPQEFQERVTLAETARDSADQETRRLLTEFYNISDGDLTAYYLDPTRAETIFEDRRRLESAGLAAASRQIVGAALDVETAEALQKENVQRREIQQRLGQRRALTQTILGEDEALTASDIASAEFGLEGDDVTAMRRRREERATGFRGRSGALATASGITTLGEAE
jgi:hypothetical protein